jgi:HK97 family phage prohead protease
MMTNLFAPELRTRRASLRPASIDPESRQFAAVVATDAPVRVTLPDGRVVIERLLCTPDAVDLSRVEAGAVPLLADHQRSARAVLGRLLEVSFEPGRLVGRFAFTEAEDAKGLWERVADGTLRNVSVGYTVQQYQEGTPAADGTQTLIAVQWSLLEVSMTPVPADARASVRSEPATSRNKEQNNMLDNVSPAPPAPDIQAERKRIASLEAPAAKARAMGMHETTLVTLKARAMRKAWTLPRSRASCSTPSPRVRRRMRRRALPSAA